MDIPAAKKSRSLNKSAIGVLSITFTLILVYLFLYSNDRASASVTRSEVMIATVIKEDFLVDVRAPGTLQPTSLRWIAATSEGRIEQLMMQPGAKVEKDTVIMQLSNPTLLRNVDSAQFALEVAQAELVALEKRLQSNYLAQEAVVNDFQARYQNATFRLEANNALSGLQIVSELDAKENKLQQAQLASRLNIEKKRLVQLAELHVAEIRAKQAQVNQTQSLLALQQELKSNLKVTAGLDGILQEIPVEQGQQVSTGAILARVAQENKLKAELRVQESLVKNVLPGQSVTISAGGYHTVGKVIRIDPAVQNGVVVVDVSMPDASSQGDGSQGDGSQVNSYQQKPLPGARPDLRITASIEIENRANVLTLRRPVLTQVDSEVQLYVLNPNQDIALLTSVSIGSGSLDKVHVIAGLEPGAQVIVSDTSAFNNAATITLN